MMILPYNSILACLLIYFWGSICYHKAYIDIIHSCLMNTSVLKKIGLTDTEIKTYVELLSLGATSAGKIVAQTGIHRKNLYDALNKLIEKGLVTYVIENKIRVFQAKEPDNLLRYLDEKREELEEILPELNAKASSHAPEIESEIYR